MVIKKILLGFKINKRSLLIAFLFASFSVNADDQIFTLSGTNYNLKTTDTTWTDGLSLFMEQPWWQD